MKVPINPTMILEDWPVKGTTVEDAVVEFPLGIAVVVCDTGLEVGVNTAAEVV